jgi:hypothetical protein
MSSAGWWRVRERKRKGEAFEIHGASPLDLESFIGPSNLFPSDVFGASEFQSILSFESFILLKVYLFHPCLRVPRWDVDPECEPSY